MELESLGPIGRMRMNVRKTDPAFQLQDSEAREVTDSEEEADDLGFDGTPNPAVNECM